MKRTRLLLGSFVAMVSAALPAAVPFTFQSGTPAQASQVNSNFQNLDQRVGNSVGAILVTTFTNSGSGTGASAGVTGASCPTGSSITGVGCQCESDGGARNYGVLFGCDMTGSGAVSGCFPDSTYTSTKPVARALITIKCLSATQNDGGAVVAATSELVGDEIELEKARARLEAMVVAREALLRESSR